MNELISVVSFTFLYIKRFLQAVTCQWLRVQVILFTTTNLQCSVFIFVYSLWELSFQYVKCKHAPHFPKARNWRNWFILVKSAQHLHLVAWKVITSFVVHGAVDWLSLSAWFLTSGNTSSHTDWTELNLGVRSNRWKNDTTSRHRLNFKGIFLVRWPK